MKTHVTRWATFLEILIFCSLIWLVFRPFHAAKHDTVVGIASRDQVLKMLPLNNNFVFILHGTDFYYFESAGGEIWKGNVTDVASLLRLDPVQRGFIVDAYYKETHARSR